MSMAANLSSPLKRIARTPLVALPLARSYTRENMKILIKLTSHCKYCTLRHAIYMHVRVKYPDIASTIKTPEAKNLYAQI